MIDLDLRRVGFGGELVPHGGKYENYEWDGPSDIAFGHDGMPMYVQGPHDDMYSVMSTLRKTVGDGNFHYLGRVG